MLCTSSRLSTSMAHPIPSWLPALLVLAGAASFRPALACQCIAPPDHGFVHPDVTVLPANAQGVLFHAPAGAALTPAMFTATRLADGAAQTVRITDVDLPSGHPMRPRVPKGVRLMRVGVEGGFIRGVRYAVAWQEPGADGARSEIAFDIDPAPLDLAATHFATTLDGPARRTMLEMETRGGSCSVSTPVTAQAIRIQVPAALRRYAPALSLLSEARDAQEARSGAAYEPLSYRPSLCTRALFDRTAHGTGRDMLYRACGSGAERIDLRTWVGMLEISDDFVLAEPATADLVAARGQSCAPFGMLRDALERNDTAEAAHLSCQLGGEVGPMLHTLDAVTEPLPTRAQWIGLSRQADRQAAACARLALQRMLVLAEYAPPDLLDAYLMLAGETLRGTDTAAVAATLDQLHSMSRVWRRRHDPAAGQPASAQLPLLPDLLRLVEQGGDNTIAAVHLIGALGPAAREAAPELMRMAEEDGPGAAAAVRALQYLIPDDPALHRSLLAWAERPALREPAALVFQRVAGREHPAKAVALLLPLVREGNVYAIDALADLGSAAGSATPALLAGLDDAPESYAQARLLRALMQVAPDDGEVVATLSRILLGPPINSLAADDHAGLQRFTTHATTLVPVIEHLIAGVRWSHDKVALGQLIGAMALAPAQKAALLGKLEQCKVQ